MFRFSLIKFLWLLSLVFALNSLSWGDSTQALLKQNNYSAGNPQGKITVVEFFDYLCSHCMNMAPVMEEIIKSNKDVRIVFKDLPIRGEMSEFAAKAALAAGRQGKYYQLNHALLSLNGNLDEESIYKAASAHQINVKQLKRDMKDNKINKVINENVNLAKDLNVTGTPAFFIGRSDAKELADLNFVLGEMSQDDLQNAIDRVRK